MSGETERAHPHEDLRTLAKLVISAVVILAGAAVLGLAVRVFFLTSGLGG